MTAGTKTPTRRTFRIGPAVYLLSILAGVFVVRPTLSWAQSPAEGADPAQEGSSVLGFPSEERVLAGAFEITPEGEIRGLFVPAKRRADGRWETDDVRLHDQHGDRALRDSLPAGRKGYVKSRDGRFVAVVSRDTIKRVSETEIYDLGGKLVARLPQHVVAVSRNARFAALDKHSKVVEVSTGKSVDIGFPREASDARVQFAEDSDSFTSAYRVGKELHVAAFSSDGRLLWRREETSGTEPRLRNTLFSPDGDHVAVVAGELPTDRLSLHGRDGQVAWSEKIPAGNYAMAFSADGTKLLLIHRDGHSLFSVSNGKVLWKKPFPIDEVERGGSLVATKVIARDGGFLVASRSALSTAPGKKPHQTTSRVSGPDLIYTVDEAGRFDVLLNRPSGTLLVEPGRFNYEPAVTVGGTPAKVYYLTQQGLRSKNLR